MKKFYSFVLLLISVTTAMAGQSGFTFTKVTSAPSDWWGTYLLVYEKSSSNAYVYCGGDTAHNYIVATIQDDKINLATLDCALAIAPYGNGYSAMLDEYIYAGSNKILFSKTPKELSLTYDKTENAVVMQSGERVMRFNDSKDGDRFRFYLSGSMKKVTLYRLVLQIQYTLTISSGAHGVVNTSVNGNYNDGSTVMIVATPDEGYKFTQWSDGNTDNPRFVTMDKDITLEAEFERVWDITCAQAAVISSSLYNEEDSPLQYDVNGIVKSIKTDASKIGTQYKNVDFTIQDATGELQCYHTFYVDSTAFTSSDQIVVGDTVKVRGVIRNYKGTPEVYYGYIRSIHPIARVVYYTLNISAGEHGKVNSSVNGKYEEGASVTITATPDEGYEFVGWSDSNTNNPRVIKMTENITLIAEFEKKPEPCLFESLNGLKDEAIREALYAQIKDHKVLSYDEIRADRARVDVDENNHVMDIYSSCVWNIKDYCAAGEYDECECYNREHIVPQSWWGNDNNQPMRYDLHNVYPTDYAANSHRSNYLYGEVSNVQWTNSLGSEYGTGTPYGSSEQIFEPVDQYKGDIARVYFYMSTCYMDKNFTQKGHGYKVFLRDTKAQLSTTTVELLLKWHRMDPVSSKETTRNDKVEAKQGNRNPFVDMPELVEFIWGKRKGQAFSCTPGDVPDNKPGENPGQNEGVEQVVVAPEIDWAMPVYNILGQRVGEHYQGVVVQNGYKYLLQ